MSKQHRQSGWVHYSFGELLAKNLLLPRVFARLRPHFMMRLRSKYAVTLYEVLEAYVNRRESSLTASIEDVQNWLKVPKGAYPDWRELKKRVIEPAIREINDNAEDGGFIIAYEGVREGRAFTKIKFILTKTAARDGRDTLLQGNARRGRAFTKTPRVPGARYEPTDAVLDQLRTIAPGLDRQALLAQYREWSKDKTPPENPHGAFIGWVKRFTKKTAAA
jgi:hypothetical protein